MSERCSKGGANIALSPVRTESGFESLTPRLAAITPTPFIESIHTVAKAPDAANARRAMNPFWHFQAPVFGSE